MPPPISEIISPEKNAKQAGIPAPYLQINSSFERNNTLYQQTHTIFKRDTLYLSRNVSESSGEFDFDLDPGIYTDQNLLDGQGDQISLELTDAQVNNLETSTLDPVVPIKNQETDARNTTFQQILTNLQDAEILSEYLNFYQPEDLYQQIVSKKLNASIYKDHLNLNRNFGGPETFLLPAERNISEEGVILTYDFDFRFGEDFRLEVADLQGGSLDRVRCWCAKEIKI